MRVYIYIHIYICLYKHRPASIVLMRRNIKNSYVHTYTHAYIHIHTRIVLLSSLSCVEERIGRNSLRTFAENTYIHKKYPCMHIYIYTYIHTYRPSIVVKICDSAIGGFFFHVSVHIAHSDLTIR
jgi:hypothetical protein